MNVLGLTQIGYQTVLGLTFVIYENPSFRHDKATEAKGTKPFFKQSHKY